MNRKDITGWLIAIVLIVVVAMYGFYFVFLYSGFPEGSTKELVGVRAGTFGDAFGTLNAFFSGMAFLGVMITLLLQRRDLAASHQQISRQQAESQFYNILSLQQQVIQGFDLHRLGEHSHTIQGRDCFRDWQRKMRTRYSEMSIEYPSKPDISRGLLAYQKLFTSHQGDLGLYFRSLYSVFRFIEKVQGDDRKHFASVVRSLLSDYELVFLFYNCLSKGGQNFVRFANEYALFDNLDVNLLLSTEHVAHLDKRSLGRNEVALALWDAARQAVPQ